MRYLHLDVFTDRPFEGNQLAVFPEPQGLTTADMQTITREMNFSECTFIFPAENLPQPGRPSPQRADAKMRIFTPFEELPMAGHPTIGSTFALAAEGTIERGRPDFVFELGVGPTPVSLEWRGDTLSFAWMTQLLPAFGPTVDDRPALAAALGLSPQELAPDLPAQVISCGTHLLFVPIASRRAVDSISVERKALARAFRAAGLDELPVFVFTTEPGSTAAGAAQQETVYSRMFAPAFGVAEDPATGGGSGPLGCYLLHHDVVTPETARSMLSLQGVAMGRPSRIYISIDSQNGGITRVRVGGRAVMVGRGELIV
jgi:trans-2,3-dihydro-3-hydroxyanthranilate isomerase